MAIASIVALCGWLLSFYCAIFASVNKESFINIPKNFYVLHVPATSSTMSELRRPELMGRSEEFVLLTTDYQTAGHGQRGTSWESEAGKNLLFSFLFRPVSLAPGRQFFLSEALSLAVAESLDSYTDSVSVKWPNDVYWRDRKICGMLLEHDLQGSHISTTLAGVGVNVNQREFCGDAPNPVSLRQIIGRDVCRKALLADILTRFVSHYRSVCQGDCSALHSLYKYRLYHGRGLHLFRDKDGEFEAEICGISSNGHISLKKTDGREREYAFKEVSFVTGR